MSIEDKVVKTRTFQIAFRRFANFIVGILFPGNKIYKSHDVNKAYRSERDLEEIREKAIEKIVFYEMRSKEEHGLDFLDPIKYEEKKDENLAAMLKHIIGIY